MNLSHDGLDRSCNDLIMSDRATALGALYQAERTDLTGILAQSLVLVGFALTYVTIFMGLFWSDKLHLSPSVMGYGAFPAWMLIAFHALLLALVFAHGRSVAIIEKQLVQLAELGEFAEFIGGEAGTAVTDLDKLIANKRHGLVLSTLISYGGFGVIVVAFSFFCVVQSAAGQTTLLGWIVGVVVPALLYLGCLGAELLALAFVLNLPKPSPAAATADAGDA